jgi:hypothetical protein
MPRRPGAVDVTDSYDQQSQTPVTTSHGPGQLSNTQATSSNRALSMGTTVVASPRKRGSDARENGSATKKSRVSNGSAEGKQVINSAAEKFDTTEGTKSENQLLEGEEEPEVGDTTKPARRLDGFSFFDSNNPNRMISLDQLRNTTRRDAKAITISGSGLATAMFPDMNDEDEPIAVPVPVHLSRVKIFSMDYTSDTSYPYVETDFAWYELHSPSPQYAGIFASFYRYHGIAKYTIENIHRFCSLTEFRESLQEEVDPVTGFRYKGEDMSGVLPTLTHALITVPEDHSCRQSALLKSYLKKIPNHGGARLLDAPRPGTISEMNARDLDREVLKPQNLIMTTVTKSVLELVLRFDLFTEQLYSLGGDSISKERMTSDGKQRRVRMVNVTTEQMKKMLKQRKIELQRAQFREKYLSAVKILLDHGTHFINVEVRLLCRTSFYEL